MTFVRSLSGIVCVLSLTACDPFGVEAELAELVQEIASGVRVPTQEELDLVRDQMWCVNSPDGSLVCTMRELEPQNP